jgi:hypothetical protein
MSSMNGTHDIHDTAPADEGGGLDPREAATLLEQTRREAQRKFDLTSPLLSLLGAAVALVALGAVWLSVRGQHPYKGPTAPGLVVMYGILLCWIAVVVSFRRRAMAGLSGRSIRQERAYGAAVATALVGVSVFQGVLKHDGVSLGVALVATAGAFAGPRGVWLSDAIGVCVVLLGYAAAQAWLLRAPR